MSFFKLKFIWILILSVSLSVTVSAQDSLAPVSDTTDIVAEADTTVTVAEADTSNQSIILDKKNIAKKKKNYVFAKVRCAGKSFLIASPKGWVIDNLSGKSQGLDVVFYPEGWNLDYAPAIMYSRIIEKDLSTQ